ncbi:MAG: Rne/Rng family ribonuclease [Gammaproteobacteria bacterium]|nr:Rne/Rng family ribonuclease [Gammaproteobacteria bacterium]
MLINATQVEETRVAIVDGQRLEDLDIDNSSRDQKKSNIYKGKITRIEPSLEAAFVDYGAERHGFLPFKEIAKEFLTDAAFADGGRPNVKAGLKEGQEVIVQIEKEERGNKGAALTTYTSLAGRFLVLMPNNPRAGGVSRRIEGDDRAELRQAMQGLEIPDGMGIIVRTAGVGRSTEELQWDLDYQAQIWGSIKEASVGGDAPFLIYQESNVIMRALRDYFRPEIGEILIDKIELYEEARQFAEMCMPSYAKRVRHYAEEVPLFNRFQIEQQIESAFKREVNLPSGGAIVIDNTEALVSIDINSARATRGADIEETAFNTNLEAADEIGRQLRLRDIGGLIVIDFIDMLSSKHQRAVEQRLREAVKADRARIQVGKISRFGLLEMSRQRVRPSLGESWLVVCPQCKGQGMIRGIESLALSILRIVEDEAMKENTGRVLAHVPLEVATFLLNEKRLAVERIERRTGVGVLLVPSPALVTPDYEIERIRYTDTEHSVYNKASYRLTKQALPPELVESAIEEEIKGPAVRTVVPSTPAPEIEDKPKVAEPEPQPIKTESSGLFSRIFAFFGGGAAANDESKKPADSQQRSRNDSRRDGGRKERGDRNKNRKAQGQNAQKPNQSKPNAKRNDKADRKDRAETDRNNKPKAADKPQAQPKKDNKPAEAPKADKAQTEANSDTKRARGRRGGRRRNGRNQEDGQTATVATEAAAVTGGLASSAVSEKVDNGPGGVEANTADYDAVAKTPVGDAVVNAPSDAEANTDSKAASDKPSQSRGRQRRNERPKTDNKQPKAAETADQGSDSKPSSNDTQAEPAKAESAMPKADAAPTKTAEPKNDTSKSETAVSDAQEPKAAAQPKAPSSAPAQSDEKTAKPKADKASTVESKTEQPAPAPADTAPAKPEAVEPAKTSADAPTEVKESKAPKAEAAESPAKPAKVETPKTTESTKGDDQPAAKTEVSAEPAAAKAPKKATTAKAKPAAASTPLKQVETKHAAPVVEEKPVAAAKPKRKPAVKRQKPAEPVKMQQVETKKPEAAQDSE